MRDFCSLLKKDVRLMASGKFFSMSLAFLIVYTLYVNFGYVRFMDAQLYNVYLYDPAGEQETVSTLVRRVSSQKELEKAILDDSNSVGIDASTGEARLVFYEVDKETDRHRADYALSLLLPAGKADTRVIGFRTPEQRARKEITCELLFFEIAAVGFLGIAAVLFKEKSMGVIRVHAILPIRKNVFLLSKLVIFLLSDLIFALLLCDLLPPVLSWIDRTLIVDLPLLSGLIMPYLILPAAGFSSGMSLGKRQGVCLLYPAACFVCYLPMVFLLFNYTAMFHCFMVAVPALAGMAASCQDLDAFGCRSSCSGDCDDSCSGSCDGSCAGSCDDSCAGSCEHSASFEED